MSTGPPTGPARPDADPFNRLLLLTASAYSLTHHVGSLPGGLGEVGSTRWADWIDLITPYLVLLPAAAALVVARPGRRAGLAFAVGAVAYAQGQGLHLSANSIGNVAPGEAAHLWDEQVGHLVWYAGAALVTLALAMPMAARPRPSGVGAALGVPVALAVGLTWASNAVGGGTLLLSAPVAAGLTVIGWRNREKLAGLLLLAYLPALLFLLVRALVR